MLLLFVAGDGEIVGIACGMVRLLAAAEMGTLDSLLVCFSRRPFLLFPPGGGAGLWDRKWNPKPHFPLVLAIAFHGQVE